MKNIKYTLLGMLSYVIIHILLVSYGNASSHRNINSIVVEKFVSKYINSLFPPEAIKNYLFVMNGYGSLTGTFVYTGGLTQFAVNEMDASLNPARWIVHGGYSADEPEIFASFRHFYDPTEKEGNRYLHNHLDAIGSVSDINPKIDHLEWAKNHSEHQYNWENGKASIVSALTNSDKDFRDKEMAFAWRALGETLHMIADMGCPAHVRDDAHAAESFTGYKLGSPDPYEEIMEDISTAEGLADIYGKGKLDLNLQSKFKSAKTLDEIAIALATYTNQNFFTTQTISGSDIVPLIHPEKIYASPKLDQCEYDPVDFMYSKNISGNEVLMCTDLKYSWGIFKGRGYPYIDKKCTYSQAQALLPQIVEAGINTMRIYIPELKVQITEFDQEENILKGKVMHKTNSEYPREIKYNGPITIYNAKNMKKLIEVECEAGKFETEVKKLKFFSVNWDKYGVYAQIEFGKIYVKSEPYTTQIELPFNSITCTLEGPSEMVTHSDGWKYKSYTIWTRPVSPDVADFDRSGFNIKYTTDIGGYDEFNYLAEGTYDDGNIYSIRLQTINKSYTDNVLEYRTTMQLDLKNLNITPTQIDSSIAYSTSVVIEAKTGMVSFVKEVREYREYGAGSLTTGSQLTNFNQNVFTDGGKIYLKFNKYE